MTRSRGLPLLSQRQRWRERAAPHHGSHVREGGWALGDPLFAARYRLRPRHRGWTPHPAFVSPLPGSVVPAASPRPAAPRGQLGATKINAASRAARAPAEGPRYRSTRQDTNPQFSADAARKSGRPGESNRGPLTSPERGHWLIFSILSVFAHAERPPLVGAPRGPRAPLASQPAPTAGENPGPRDRRAGPGDAGGIIDELVDDPAPLVGGREELTARAESWARGGAVGEDVGGLRAAVTPVRGLVRGGGERALPADPLTVARFLTDLAPRWRPATPADPPGHSAVAGRVRERDGIRRDAGFRQWRPCGDTY